MTAARPVPKLFPNPAGGSTRAGRKDVAAWDDYESNHYHESSDDMRLPLRWDVAERWGKYIEGVVRGVTNTSAEPLWYEGDPLASVFARDQKRAKPR